ncbi:MAG: SDR family oxidoreductase [Lachnospiraceae bacterium]|nr:SDR family oxidoreductase [Lachnospiraceae bacterium]
MTDKTLLLLGASSEVGNRILEDIGDNYSLIYAHYGKNADGLKSAKERFGDKIILIGDDFSSEDAGKKVLEAIEENGIWPDHMIHLAAPGLEHIRFSKSTYDDFEKNLNICFKSAVTVSKDVIKHMDKDKKGGRVIFMLSSVTDGMPPKFMTPYVTAKYALLGFMKSLSTEYAGKGITVNGISPGMMETKFLSGIIDHAIEDNASKSPFGRNLYVEEVIPAFRFLLSDDASKITGQNMVVTGGM